jgi:hypothetical protein
MAIRAHELALLDLFPRLARFTASNDAADISALDVSREVVPRHRPRMKEASAVSARVRCLQVIHPFGETAAVQNRLPASPNPVPCEVLAVVFAPTVLAPVLTTALGRLMKLIQRLPSSALTTQDHVVILDIRPDDIISVH